MALDEDAWVAPDDPLGAFSRENHAALSGSGSGPLAGLTFAAKDVFHIEGFRTGFGQPDWLATHEPATETARVVQQLLDAGADMRGRTLTDELAYSLTGENVHYGMPVNPRDPDRVPGGSSSGSVSAVAGGLVDFALGTDCGGSVRLPASYCGVFGMRPSHGRASLQGVIPFAPSFDTVGWFARDPGVLKRVAQVLLEPAGETVPPRRLLFATDAFDLVDKAVAEVLEGAGEALSEIIGTRAQCTVSPDGLWSWFETFRVIQAAEIWSNHGAWITTATPKFGPGIRERVTAAAEVTEEQVAAQREKREGIIRQLDQLLSPGDVLCLPTSPRIAPRKSTPTDEIEVRYRNQAICLLCIAGLGGLPQISLPVAELDGMPLGLSIVGPRGCDLALLALAQKFWDRAAREPWFIRR